MSESLPLSAGVSRSRALARLLGYSLIGLLLFFVPFELGGRSTILLDHAASALQLHARPLVIGVAVGEEKVHAIRGAARARLVSALVTDAPTAEALLETAA